MAKISQLEPVVTPDGTETVVVLKNGETRRATMAGVLAPQIEAAEAVRDEAQRFTATAAAVTADLAARIPETVEADYAWAVADPAGRAAIGVKNDGTFRAGMVEADSVNGVPAASLANAAVLRSTPETFPFAIADETGRAALAIAEDGSTHVADLVCTTINGRDPAALGGVGAATPVVPDGDFIADIVMFTDDGQSNGEGAGGNVGLTLAAEYDNICFPARSTSPTAFLPLTVANGQATFNGAGRGESPMYGALGHIKRLIEAEEGLTSAQQPYQLLAVNDAASGEPIETFVKGTGIYQQRLSQVQAAYDLAQAAGKTSKVAAMFWTQGEAGSTTGTYKATLLKLIADWNADVKAITGQTEDVILICYQTPTNPAIALEQLQAHIESPLVVMAGPMSHLPFWDDKHLTAIGIRILGGYYGLVHKREQIDRKAYEPLRPRDVERQGRIVTARFHVPTLPLRFEVDLVPAQANMGFQILDANDQVVPIASVRIAAPDRVRIVAAGPIPAGARLVYGNTPAVGRAPFFGGCGNLRDSRGDGLVFHDYPMHAWCVTFSWPL